MDVAGARAGAVELSALAPALLAAVMAAAQPQAGQAPAALYDRPGARHDEQCVATAGGRAVPVRDVDGAQLQTAGGAVSDPPQRGEACSRTPGVRLEGIEALSTGPMTLYYTWPLEGGSQAPGFIAAGELASRPSLDGAAAAGNGAPAPQAPGGPVYAIDPQDIPFEQRYGGPSTSRWYTYSVYGRPVGGASFALLSWSWIDVPGGGIARAAVAAGALFHPADVQAITLVTRAGAGAPVNGTVTAVYGYVWDRVAPIYGWMVSSHSFGETCVDHMSYVGGGPPVAGISCPAGLLRDSIADGPSLAGG